MWKTKIYICLHLLFFQFGCNNNSKDDIGNGIQLMGKDYKRAIQYFSNDVKLGNPNAAILRGICYRKIRQYDSAIVDFINAGKLGSTLNYHSYIANTYHLSGDYKNALIYYHKYDDSAAIATMHLLLGNYEIAKLYCNDLYLKGVIYSRLNDRPNSIICFLSVIKKDSTDYLAELSLGNEYTLSGNDQAALVHLQQAIKKGFRFYDLLDSNYFYKGWANKLAFNKLINESKFEHGNSTINKINKIISDDKLSDDSDYSLLFNRQMIILASNSNQDYYRKCTQILDESVK